MHIRIFLLALCVTVTIYEAHGQSHADRVASPLAATAPTVVPALVLYADVAEGADGKPLVGEATATFLLFKDEAGGEPLWAESQRVLVDATGHYRAQLGASSPSGLPLEVFATGEARWLEVQIAGQRPRVRVLLSSVPYAAKAADAATLGGLPPSAFMLAGSKISSDALVAPAVSSPDSTSNVTTTGGKSDYVPRFTGTNTVISSEIYDNGTNVGIGVVPNSSVKFDIGGSMIVRGNTIVSRQGNATTSKGYPSYAFDFYSNVYNSSTKTAANPYFSLQSEPTGNNTSSPSATFNLLFSKSGTPAETGLYINPNGTMHFASGQTFPGTGDVSSVALTAPSSDFTVTGSPITNSGTLGFNWTVAPTSNDTANAIVKRDSAGGFVAGKIFAYAGTNGYSSDSGISGAYGNNSDGGPGVFGIGGTGVYGTGAVGVEGVSTGGTGVFGTGTIGFATDSNVQQARAAGGWVKAMVYVLAGDGSGSSIKQCFNSTLTGSAASTPPCGIGLTSSNVPDDFKLTFNFETDDRFFSVTPADGHNPFGANSAGTDVVEVYGPNPDNFYLIVY